VQCKSCHCSHGGACRELINQGWGLTTRTDSIEGRQLQGVAHQLPVDAHQRLAARQHARDGRRQFPGGRLQRSAVGGVRQARHALEQQVVRRQRARLVEAAHLHLPHHRTNRIGLGVGLGPVLGLWDRVRVMG